MTTTDIPGSRALAGAIYFGAAVLILSNFLDLGANVWPFRPSTPEWRYGAVGLAGGFLLTPLLGTMIALVFADRRGDSWGMLAFALPAIVVGGMALIGVPFFLLDSLQVKANVAEELTGPFQFGIGKALFKLTTGGVALLWCGAVGVKAFRKLRKLGPAAPRTSNADAKDRLVVGS